MQGLLTVEELVVSVLLAARDMTPRKTVELGILHGFCLDVAQDLAPELVPVLSSTDGLRAVVDVLEQCPDVVVADDDDQSFWRFV